MPFRTLDPADADRLAAAQARREAVEERVRAGKRARLVVSQRRKELEEQAPAYRAEREEGRCQDRLAAADSSEFWAAFWLITVLCGPWFTIALGAILYGMDAPWWACLPVGASGLVIAYLVVTSKRSQRRHEKFRAVLRTFPFPITGAEETLAREMLTEMSVLIAPVGELPADTVANLVALIAPGVRVDRAGEIMVERQPDGIAIVRRFETFQCEDGSIAEKDSGAPAKWLQALIPSTLVPLHELHGIASVDVTGGR